MRTRSRRPAIPSTSPPDEAEHGAVELLQGTLKGSAVEVGRVTHGHGQIGLRGLGLRGDYGQPDETAGKKPCPDGFHKCPVPFAGAHCVAGHANGQKAWGVAKTITRRMSNESPGAGARG